MNNDVVLWLDVLWSPRLDPYLVRVMVFFLMLLSDIIRLFGGCKLYS